MENTALITGGAGGLGLALARLLASNGWHVFAADCDQAGLDALAGETGITPLYVDVTDTDSVETAFQSVAGTIEHLTAIVNFAGILRVGPLVELDDKAVQSVLDINIMGTYRMNKAFFPLINAGERKGRIVNISSETGWHTAAPFNGPYAMSKHAIEAYSDSLRRELSIFDIPVICVQPGPFTTQLVEGSVAGFAQAADASQLYASQLRKFGELVVKANNTAHDPALLARVIHQALTSPRPKLRYSVKADKGRSFLELLPMTWADRLFRKLLSDP